MIIQSSKRNFGSVSKMGGAQVLFHPALAAEQQSAIFIAIDVGERAAAGEWQGGEVFHFTVYRIHLIEGKSSHVVLCAGN